jgi:hypothetical protein
MRFFADRHISIYIVKMLAAYSEREHEVRHLDQDDRFEKTTGDEVWLRTIGADQPQWAVLSADLAILDRPPERKALEEANLTFFGFDRRWLKMAFHEQAWRLVKVWPAIVEKAESRVGRPTIFKVHWGSSLEIEELGHTRPGGRHKS